MDQISPELVLVCPELRAIALQHLPEPDPDSPFAAAARQTPTGSPTGPGEATSAPTPTEIAPAIALERPSTLSAFLLYLTGRFLTTVVQTAAIIAVVVAIILLAELARMI